MTVSPLALGLILAASVGWGVMDVLRKKAGAVLTPSAVLVWLMGVQGLGFLALALATGAPPPPREALGLEALILALNVGSNWLFIRAVSVSPLSLTIPMLSFTPVFSALVARPILGEEPSARQLVGIALVVLGALSLGAGRARGAAGGRGVIAAILAERGAALMLGVALTWSIIGPLDKRALQLEPMATHATVQTLGVAVVLGILALARGRGQDLAAGGRHLPLILLTAAVGGAALALQLHAYPLTLVSLVESLKRVIGLVMAVALGRVLFAEPVTPGKVAAVVLMGGGTVLIVG